MCNTVLHCVTLCATCWCGYRGHWMPETVKWQTCMQWCRLAIIHTKSSWSNTKSFELLTAVNVKIVEMTSCRLPDKCLYFWGACYLHLQNIRLEIYFHEGYYIWTAETRVKLGCDNSCAYEYRTNFFICLFRNAAKESICKKKIS